MFRTEIPFTPHPLQLPRTSRILTIGSCFSDTIGKKLAAYKVETLVNPFGTVFNPLSAGQLLRAAMGEETDWQQHLVEARGRWQSYDLHATIGAESPVVLLQDIQALAQRTGEFLRTADVVLFTLGSAFVYRLLETGEIVNNCHKVPAERFAKELLTPDEIINAVAETHAYLRRHNPTLRFILTVSPVRHLKDTLPLNAVSKSVLRVACHYLSELLPDVAYFHAYELLLDDLRDYRFYAEDMLHPSAVAEDYIWERFTRTYFDAEFGRFKREWHSVRQALAHRPLYPAAPEHRQFLEHTLEQLQRLSSQADVQAELADVRQQLLALPLPVVPEPLPEEEDEEERIDIGEHATEHLPVVPIAATEEPVLVEEDSVEAVSLTETLVPTTAEPLPEDRSAELTQSAADTAAAEEAAGLLPKKKRRSRGGAKRTARKRAALAALEAAEAGATISQPVARETAVVEAAEQAVPMPAVSTQTPQPAPAEAALPTPQPQPIAVEGNSPPLPPPSPTAADVSLPTLAPTPEPVAQPRRGRTAGQILAAKKRRPGKSKTAATSQAAPVAPATVLPAPTTEPASEAEAPVAAAPAPPTESGAAEPIAPAPVAPAAPPEAEATPIQEAVAPVAPVEATPTEETPVASVEAPPTEETLETPAPEAATTEKKAPTKPRAPRRAKAPAKPAEVAPKAAKPKAPRKKAAPSAPADSSDQPPAAEEKPKRRPTRKKPTPTDDNPPAA